VTEDRAISGGPSEEDPSQVSIVHLGKKSRGSARGDPIADRRMGVSAIPKIDPPSPRLRRAGIIRPNDHCRRSR